MTHTVEFDAPRRKRVTVGKGFMDVSWASIDEIESYRRDVLMRPNWALETIWDMLKFDIDPVGRKSARISKKLEKALAGMTAQEIEQLAAMLQESELPQNAEAHSVNT